jgi:hypothetical protein
MLNSCLFKGLHSSHEAVKELSKFFLSLHH